MSIIGWVAALLMFFAIFLIPIGWPGLWIMVGIVAVGALLGELGPGILVFAAAVAGAAELIEFLIVRRMSLRYGGSTRAFWGAVIGGTLGLFVGFPVPILGPVIAGIIGSFAGAAAVALWESRDVAAAGRVGWGVILARILAAFVKVAAAMVILVVGGTAWIVA